MQWAEPTIERTIPDEKLSRELHFLARNFSLQKTGQLTSACREKWPDAVGAKPAKFDPDQGIDPYDVQDAEMYQSVLARGAVMPVSALLTAADVMTRDVVSVGPNTSLRWVATLLSKYRISGMPVVDDEDYPLGMITESDLLRWRDEPTDQQAWWLNMLADGFELSSDFLENVRADREKVRNFMCSPATTVSESALLRDVARVMMEKNIKRAVVIGEGQDRGRMVGIVSRGDLIRAMMG